MKKILILLAFIIVFISFIVPLVLVNYFNIDFSQLGTYGDFFGSFNSLVSLLAFVGLIYTIQLQREDLKIQREELKLTREELKKQAEAQEKAAAEQARQAELLAEQINKDIRPYINVFWAGPSEDPYLVIRNIGKSSCSNFKINVPFERNQELYSIAKGLTRRLNNFRIASFPSMEEYSVPLFDEWKDTLIESCIINYRSRIVELVKKEIKMILDVSFDFRGKNERFEITFDFGNTPIPRNRQDTSSVKIVQGLIQIKKSIDDLNVKNIKG